MVILASQWVQFKFEKFQGHFHTDGWASGREYSYNIHVSEDPLAPRIFSSPSQLSFFFFFLIR